MKTASNRQRGFSDLLVVIIILVIGVVGLGAWYVWGQNKENGSNNSKQSDPYEGWQTYTNATYGISFRYPADWKVEEGSFKSPDLSATRQEYAINLMRNEDVKYNGVISIEVLDQNLEKTGAWYYPEASPGKGTKTTKTLKGKSSIQYAAADSTRLRYLFSVGSKTYLFESINEELNAQLDPNYWAKFDGVFNSLQIHSP